MEGRWFLASSQPHGTLNKIPLQNEQEYPFHSLGAEAGGVESLARFTQLPSPRCQLPAGDQC